jgi:hypothetical protein
MAHQLADADKDGKRFVALVHHLLSKIPTPPVATAIEIAKRKVAPLLGRFEAKPEQNWTEEELADWLDTLDEHMQGLVQKAVQGYKDINGTDLIGFLSRARRTLEESAQQDAPKNQMSLLHAWYIWQEESRLHEQQTYFTRENRKARGW